MSSLWCEEHDHLKRSCPWCEIDALNREIAQLNQEKKWQCNEILKLYEDNENLREDRDDLIALLEYIRDEVDGYYPSGFAASIRLMIDEALKEVERKCNYV